MGCELNINRFKNNFMKQINQIFASTLALALVLGIVLPASALAAAPTPVINSPVDGSHFNIGQTISFSASATGGAEPYSYVWTFGDSTSSFGQTVTKSYSTAGTKTVRVTVAGHDEAQSNVSINVIIDEPGTVDPLTITNIRVTDVTQNSAIIRWTTNRVADSRVIYDTVSHANISGQSAPNYGYANSTATSDTTTKVTEHAVTVTGLSANTQYFFRVISQE